MNGRRRQVGSLKCGVSLEAVASAGGDLETDFSKSFLPRSGSVL